MKVSFSKKIKLEVLHVFAGHLAILIDAGVPLLSALEILAQQAEDEKLKEVLEVIARDVREGSSLTRALAKHPKVFSTLFVAMVEAAEKSGNMAKVLQQLSDYLKSQDSLEKKIKSALSYPKFVLSFFFLVLLAIVFGLIPKFKGIFESFDAKLPLPTEILLRISEFAKSHLLLELLLGGLIIFLFKRYKATTRGRAVWDKLMLKAPVFGDIVSKSLLSKFNRTMGVLLQSGLSVIESLEIAGQLLSNVHFNSAVKQIRKGIIDGRSLSNLLKAYPVFPTMMVKMVAVGEASGSLEKMLNKIADMYDDHTENKVTGLSAILEPALMVGLGALALVVIVALYLPIFNLSGAIN